MKSRFYVEKSDDQIQIYLRTYLIFTLYLDFTIHRDVFTADQQYRKIEILLF